MTSTKHEGVRMEHHEKAITAYAAQLRQDPANLALIVVGSVARGSEREDSDVDVYVVVDEETFARNAAADTWAWVDRRGEDYPGSYIDVKMTDLAYLRRAAQAGDDPTRASFRGARVVFSEIAGLEEVIAAITELPEEAWAERVASHVAQVRLHGGYFLRQAEERGDDFLLAHAATHLALAAARAALAHAHVLLPGPKYVSALVREVETPIGFVEAWGKTIAEPGTTTANVLIGIVDEWLGQDQTPAQSLSVFIRDNELAWLRGTIPAEYY